MENKERLKNKKRFLRFFPKGFRDKKYTEWERNYKWEAHLAWERDLNKETFRKLLSQKKYKEIAKRAINLETKTNLLFSFEKMALRDAVKSPQGAKLFAIGLYDYVYGEEPLQTRFENFTRVLESLPRKQTRVLTWPLQTIFGFIANPNEHIFLKPKTTKRAAEAYHYDFNYASKPNWNTYKSLLAFGAQIKKDVKDLMPKDMIDIQSYLWVMGSDEYLQMEA